MAASNTVVVGCKLPNGLICELDSKDGTKKVVRLNGANSSVLVGGYGLTTTDADFMNAWLKQYAQLKFVKNGLVFIQSSTENAQAQAVDGTAIKTGVERLDPNKTPAGVTKSENRLPPTIETAPTPTHIVQEAGKVVESPIGAP